MRSPKDQDHAHTSPRSRSDWWRSFVRPAELKDFEGAPERPKYRCEKPRMVGVISAEWADLRGECTRDPPRLRGDGPGPFPRVTFGLTGRAELGPVPGQDRVLKQVWAR